MKIPDNMNIGALPKLANASGIRCRNAADNNVPDANAIRSHMYFLSMSCFSASKIIPTNDRATIKSELAIISNSMARLWWECF